MKSKLMTLLILLVSSVSQSNQVEKLEISSCSSIVLESKTKLNSVVVDKISGLNVSVDNNHKLVSLIAEVNASLGRVGVHTVNSKGEVQLFELNIVSCSAKQDVKKLVLIK